MDFQFFLASVCRRRREDFFSVRGSCLRLCALCETNVEGNPESRAFRGPGKLQSSVTNLQSHGSMPQVRRDIHGRLCLELRYLQSARLAHRLVAKWIKFYEIVILLRMAYLTRSVK